MKRIFIMRKDLHMSAGKLAAQVGHCAEAYWTTGIRRHTKKFEEWNEIFGTDYDTTNMEEGIFNTEDYFTLGIIDKHIFEDYICGSFVKIICQARNKNHLLKAKTIAEEMGMEEGIHYGLIYDNCLTELEPEEENGTTLTGIWFCPLPDEKAEQISRKYHLYT